MSDGKASTPPALPPSPALYQRAKEGAIVFRLPQALEKASRYSLPISDLDMATLPSPHFGDLRHDARPMPCSDSGLVKDTLIFSNDDGHGDKGEGEEDSILFHEVGLLQKRFCDRFERVQSVSFLGTMYQVGQVVAVKGKDGSIFFVAIRSLYLNEYGQKFFSFYWLHPFSNLPHLACQPVVLQMPYGSNCLLQRASLHKTVESLDCIIGPIQTLST
jgi:hypothetical protein